MTATAAVRLLLLVSLAAPLPSATARAAAAAPDSTALGPPDSTGHRARIVRRFPPVEVVGTLRDLRSSQTVHRIPGPTLQTLPVDGLVEAVALQAGVVSTGGELHVRGGRAGETVQYLDGIALSEPLRRRMLEVPLLALRDVELVTGAPEAQVGSGLAGALQLHSVDPSPRLAADARWSTDFRLADHYDRASARVNVPLGGIGAVAALDGTLDDTWNPTLRTRQSFDGAGSWIGRRTEDLLQAWLKVAPLAAPGRLSAQVLTSRRIHQPYDPAWTYERWDPVSRSIVYRAADHFLVSEDRQAAALLSSSIARPGMRAGATLGWLRTRSVTSVSGAREDLTRAHGAIYGSDPFRVIGGDYPLYQESGSDVVTLRGDVERSTREGDRRFGCGAAVTHEEADLREMDWSLVEDPLDPLREWHASAPGGSGYVQGRWASGGLVLNGGLRGEYWTPGEAGKSQTLPWDGRGSFLFSPRFGVAYPVSVRDAVSFSYARISQAPARDFLYDRRTAISNRQPLGNPALEPETVISYEAAVQHLFGPTFAMQGAVFYRDLYDQIGARDYAAAGLPVELRYDNAGNGHAIGFEWSVSWTDGGRRHAGARYTWMDARGYESRPEGQSFGTLRAARDAPTGDRPLSWDRRHTIVASAAFPWRDRWELSWSTSVGSPLPWTPRFRSEDYVDPLLINGRRLTWTECTSLNVRWKPLATSTLVIACEVRNLFDTRGEIASTTDGYPSRVVNTVEDEYGAYRTETGQGGGAYWVATGDDTGYWVPVHDPRLYDPPRSVRMSFSGSW
jgi:outer membrane receptor protein involved in Fe transport